MSLSHLLVSSTYTMSTLILPYCFKRFYRHLDLDVDASSIGLGAVLMQQDGECLMWLRMPATNPQTPKPAVAVVS